MHPEPDDLDELDLDELIEHITVDEPRMKRLIHAYRRWLGLDR